MDYKDKVLKCVECGTEFVFTAGEQMFYADKGFKNEPKRCKNCKAKRSQSAGGGSSTRVVTTTVCSQCGKETTVPFKLTQEDRFIAGNVFSKGERPPRQADRNSQFRARPQKCEALQTFDRRRAGRRLFC